MIHRGVVTRRRDEPPVAPERARRGAARTEIRIESGTPEGSDVLAMG